VKTLAAPARFEAEIKRSRFIAHAARVDSMADTLDFYESVADPSATHNCWAWGLDHRYRFNDDGEPASTAGKPIHAAIEGKGLDNVMVVVTRYYGGIKLGVGGLVRAYGGGASKCLDQAVVVEVLPKVNCLIEADFKWTGQLYAALDACEAKRLGEDYPPGRVQIRAELLESALPGLKEQLRDATRGEALVRLAV
jgi:uncharacterized YigZ family protein